MSQALLLYLLNNETINISCTKLKQVREIRNNKTCGFNLLFAILAVIFPHLGAPCLDVVEIISTLKIHPQDTLSTFYSKTVAIQNKLTVSRNSVPATSLTKRFLAGFEQNNKAQIILASVKFIFTTHLEDKGPDVPFPFSITAIYNILVKSGISPNDKIMNRS